DPALADQAIDRGALVADRGLHVAQPRRRAPERAFPRHRVERDQVAHLDAGPPLACHERSDVRDAPLTVARAAPNPPLTHRRKKRSRRGVTTPRPLVAPT